MMEKKVYVSPAMSVCRMEANQMMASSPAAPGRYDNIHAQDIEVLSNKNNAWDLW